MPTDIHLIPHFEQYFQPWAMEDGAFEALRQRIQTMDLAAHLASVQARVAAGEDATPKPCVMTTDDGIAVIELVGTMTKYGSSLSDAPASVELRRTIRTLSADPKITGLMLLIDSPGGSVAGTSELASAVADASAIKPCAAYIEDTGASGAYWVASQAGRLTTNDMAVVGSIGTLMVRHDTSQAAAAAGTKVIVTRTGKMKGAGVPGTEVTAEMQAEDLRIANQINDQFINSVAKARGVTPDKIRALEAGVHVGQHAAAKGLTDGVETFDAALANLRSRIATKSKSSPARSAGTPTPKEHRMSETTPPASAADQPKAATLAELKSIKGSTAEFREKCQDEGLTLHVATTRWLEHLTTENDALKAKTEKPGQPPLATGPTKPAEPAGDAIAQWNTALQVKVAAGMTNDKAVRSMVHENPDLHQAYVEAINATKPKSRR